jgi:broad specificity phosphatase PhoE
VCALKPEMDRPLTEEGKLQALAAGVALREIVGTETVSFFVSPYKSCKQTFQFLSGSFTEQGVNYTEDPRLRNQYYGDWKQVQEARNALDEDVKKVGLFYYVYQGGEAAADVYDRVSSFMETLYRKWEQPRSAQNYVILTHNIVILCFLMRWFHWDVATFHRLSRFGGGQLAIMEKQPDGSYRLVCVCCRRRGLGLTRPPPTTIGPLCHATRRCRWGCGRLQACPRPQRRGRRGSDRGVNKATPSAPPQTR